MRVLFVCKSLPTTFKGGIQTHVWALSAELIARGCEVSILTAGTWRKAQSERLVDGRRIVSIGYFPGRRVPGLRKSLEEISFNVAAWRYLRRSGADYDIVHLQGRSGCFYAASCPRDRPHRVVSTYHRLLPIEYEYAGQSSTWLDGVLHRSVMHFAERRAAHRSDHVVAVSEEMHRELRDACGERLAPVSILANGVHRWFGDPIADPNPNQLVYVGRLEKIKGVDLLLEAMRSLPERVSLHIIGEGPERGALRSLTRRYGIAERVRFHGDQDADAVRYWVQRSLVLVLPSYHETQGIVLLEAGICGRAVVAASAPGIDEVVDHGVNGLMFPAGDARSLGVVLQHLLQTPRLAHQLGAAGRRRAASDYDWRSIAASTHQLYQTLHSASSDGPKTRKRSAQRAEPTTLQGTTS